MALALHSKKQRMVTCLYRNLSLLMKDTWCTKSSPSPWSGCMKPNPAGQFPSVRHMEPSCLSVVKTNLPVAPTLAKTKQNSFKYLVLTLDVTFRPK